MFIDFRKVQSVEEIECDICIIGAGAAGISIAYSLIDSGINVCLLESGGFNYEVATQSLYEGESVGIQGASPMGCRLRYFGGTTNHWGGYCRPLDDIDFEKRSWIPNSGWPFGKTELEPYYEKACSIVEIGTYDYFSKTFINNELNLPKFHPEKLEMRNFQFSRPATRFGMVYRKALEKATDIKVFLHANVIRLDANKTASAVRAVEIKTLEGKHGRVRAKKVVLACGGMENPRILLFSNNVESNGLGNSSGSVGRFFNMHVEHAAVGHILTSDRSTFSSFNKYKKDGKIMAPSFGLSKKIQREDKILNCSFEMFKAKKIISGYEDFAGIAKDLRGGKLPSTDFSNKLWSVMTDLDSVFAGVYKRISRGKGGRNIPALYVRAETAPNRDSRISLGNELDKLGLPKIKADWQLTDFDKHSIRISLNRIAEEFGRLNLGRIQLDKSFFNDDKTWPASIWSGCHHMGTTRMTDDPKQGVVDRNCRVHTVKNLYIAGSSVFPTGGNSTPTLTIVALALRLADHLKKEFFKT